MTLQEMTALAEGLIPVVKEQMQRGFETERATFRKEIAALDLRVLELETRPATIGPAGPQGEKGDRGERGERGEQGARGADGAPGERGSVGEKGERGEVGPEGKAGLDGKDGRDGINGKDGAAGLNGQDGAPGKDGINGKDGKDGLDGKDGRDGLGISDAFIDRDKSLVLTFTDGRTKSLGIVVGRDGEAGQAGRDVDMAAVAMFIKGELESWPRPKDGINGKDGILGVEELAFDFDGERTVTVKAKKTGYPLATWVFPNTIDRGVFEAGMSYQRGDGVTHEGQYYIAKSDTVQEPGEGSTDWRLSVRRGKQGRDGKQGPPGLRGEKGDTGLQGPQGPMGRPVGV